MKMGLSMKILHYPCGMKKPAQNKFPRCLWFDLARCLRQNLYIDYIIPEVLDRLWKDPMLGHMASGELIELLSRIEKRFWSKNPELRNQVEKLTNAILNKDIVSPDYQLEEWIVEEFFCDVRKLKNKLQ